MYSITKAIFHLFFLMGGPSSEELNEKELTSTSSSEVQEKREFLFHKQDIKFREHKVP